MEKALCLETNINVYLIHQGFDIAIIQREGSKNQECVNISTLNVKKRSRPNAKNK
jgi:hypothetical protein